MVMYYVDLFYIGKVVNLKIFVNLVIDLKTINYNHENI